MGAGSLSRVRLYAPFLALIAVQALLVALVPSTSTPGGEQAGFGGGGQGTQQAAGGGDDGDFEGSDLDRDSNGGGADVGGGGTGSGAGSASGAGQASPADDGSGGEGSGDAGEQSDDDGSAGQAASGDTSHCTADGRQHDVVFHSPECVPVWAGGDNGGATYTGVTEDEITVLWLVEESNEQVDAVAGTAIDGPSPEEHRGHLEVLEEFLNQYYEFYGRRIDLDVHYLADCPQSPADVPGCRAEVRRMMSEREPFMVIWATPIYPDIFDEFARAGVVSLGGAAFAEEAFTQHRPYRWDLAMDGTEGLQITGEYFCKKLEGGNASHGGQIIHPSIGTRDSAQRKMGIISREAEANVAAANRLRRQVQECSGQDVPLVTYDTNIERAQEQAGANTAALIAAGVTTVVCNCDVIRPVFITNNFTSQSYFPEHLVTGLQGIDFDVIGRLMDQEQWQHAFGLSHLPEPVDWNESASQRVSEAVGRDERFCNCPVETDYVLLVGRMLQLAGPRLDPENFEAAMLDSEPRGGWEASGQDPTIRLHRFGPNDYTAASDVREVYWDRTSRSKADGDPGAYVAINDGRRYVSGELSSGFAIPQPSR